MFHWEEEARHFSEIPNKTRGDGQKLQQKKDVIKPKQKFLHAEGGQILKQGPTEAVKSPLLEIFNTQKQKMLSNLTKLSLIFKGIEQMMFKGPFQPETADVAVVLELCLYRYLAACIPHQTVLTSYRFSQCCWFGVFPGAVVMTFLLKPPESNDKHFSKDTN